MQYLFYLAICLQTFYRNLSLFVCGLIHQFNVHYFPLGFCFVFVQMYAQSTTLTILQVNIKIQDEDESNRE